MIKKIVFLLMFCWLIPFSINAKVYDPGPIDDADYLLSYFSVAGSNYCVRYSKDSKHYVKTKNQVYGPYDFVPKCIATENNIVFYYRDPANYNKYFVNSNGSESGSHQLLDGVEASGNNTMYVYTISGEANKMVVLNSQEYGPYTDVAKYSVDGANWAFSYSITEDNYNSFQHYVNIKGDIYGPYDSTGDIKLHNNNWIFEYRQNSKRYYNFKGQIIEMPNTKMVDFDDEINLSDDNSWGFIYNDTSQDKEFVNINNTIYGPYDRIYPKSLIIIDKSRWGFVYYSSGSYYVLINGTKYGPYNNVYDFSLTKNHWAISTDKAGSSKIASRYLYIDDKYVDGFNNIEFPHYLPLYRDNKQLIVKALDYQSYYFFDGDYKIGPFTDVGSFEAYPNSWAFSYKKNGKMYLKYVDGIYDGIDKKLIFSNEPNNAIALSMSDITGQYDINNRQFKVSWKTNIEASGWIEYELMPGNIRSGVVLRQDEVSGLRTEHQVVINNIDSIYGVFYRPYSQDAQGNIEQTVYKKYLSGQTNVITPAPTPTPTSTPTPTPAPTSGPTPTPTPTLYTSPTKINIKNTSMHSRLKGKIMLKVESAGEAYYVHPSTQEMHYLGRPDDAFSVMREQGVGVTNDNLEKIPVGLGNLTGPDSDGDGLPDLFEDAVGTDKNNQDTDGDGFNDKDELISNYNPNGAGSLSADSSFSNIQKGKIFLQVQRNGEAWYINPNDGKRYFLGRPADAFQVMRNLGLGISNTDFDSMK